MPAFLLLDSGLPGPAVAVVAGIHGDEGSGPIAARELASAGPPRRGRLLVLAEANPAALAASSRAAPGGRDLNRLFPRTGSGPAEAAPAAGRDPEEARAEALLGVLLGEADLVLDLHEEGGAWDEADLPTLVLTEAAAELALELVEELRDLGMPFDFVRGAPEGSLAGELGGRGRAALVVEAPARLPLEERVRVHLAAVRGALGLLGMR
ncbi:MAG TPA: succinylglutamate desuccinylase/aspartoacylase family protein [Spirochaetia bacterium]|nr:succinylglutamate desuccinylase/aspartoacylase family protein [Spirochaetia bacterium]